MPQKHKPKRLEEMALVAVGSWFKLFGQFFIESKAMADPLDSKSGCIMIQRNPIEEELQLVEVREKLFTTLPCYLFDNVADQVLMTVKNLIDENHSRYAALTEVAMHPRIKKISFSEYPTAMQQILLANLCRLTDIESLHSVRKPTVWKTHKTEKFFLAGFQSMTKLTTCCLLWSTTNAMISALGRNCPALQELDISYSNSVTDCGLPALFNCKHLRKVNLFETSVTSRGYKNLLINLPGIRNLGHCDYFGSVLEQLHGQSSDPLSLVDLECTHMTSKQLKFLVHYCPSLKSVSLWQERNFFHKGDLSILKELQNLQHLTLDNYDFFSDCVKNQLLEYIGYNLYVLDLISMDNIDLIYISQYLPNLKDISFRNCAFADHDLIHFDHKKLAVSPFSYLQRLECISVYCPKVHLEFMMSHCKNVKYIELGLSTDIDDGMMSRVLARNEMKSLEELIIYHSRDLSIQSVELLMTHCDQLCVIGDLKSWEGISPSQLADFQAYIRSNNINLTPGGRLQNGPR